MPPPRVAVVDDDLPFLHLMGDVLKDAGWEPILQRDSRTAIARLSDTHPDFILLDIHMESVDAGWEILTYLLLHPVLYRIPVAVLSAAVVDIEAKRPWLDRHQIPVLHKPFDIDDLYEVVLAGLGTRRPLRLPRAAIA